MHVACYIVCLNSPLTRLLVVFWWTVIAVNKRIIGVIGVITSMFTLLLVGCFYRWQGTKDGRIFRIRLRRHRISEPSLSVAALVSPASLDSVAAAGVVGGASLFFAFHGFFPKSATTLVHRYSITT